MGGCNCKNKLSGAAATLIRGSIGLTKSVLGIDLATEADIAARREICRSCEFSEKRIDPDGSVKVRRCMKCGCFIAHKTRLASEECPIGLWSRTKPIDRG